MKRTYSRQIINNIDNFPKGKAFTWRDVMVSGVSSGSIQRVLSRLEASSKIRRNAQGIYYVPSETVIGPRPLPPESLLEKLILEKRARDKSLFGDERRRVNRLIPVGPSLFYEIGLTTQVPARQTFIAPLRLPHTFKAVKVTLTAMEKYQELSDEELKAWLALVDLDRVANESREEVARSYARYMRVQAVPRKRLREICSMLGGQKSRRALTNLEYVEGVVWPKS